MKTIIRTNNAPAAVGAYSQGIEVGGIYFFSGQIGLHPTTMLIAEDFQEQLDQVLSNLDSLLLASDLRRQNIVKTTVFLTDLQDFALVNKAYEKFFPSPFPARSCVQVVALPKNAKVEIEMIAAK